MINQIIFKKIWEDNDALEIEVSIKSTKYFFQIKVYTHKEKIKELINALLQFEKSTHGGIYDLQLGSFGSEYANGAFNSRFQYQTAGKINCKINFQSEFFDFGKEHLANELKLNLVTEPALIQNFIEELKKVDNGLSNEASLELLQ